MKDVYGEMEVTRNFFAYRNANKNEKSILYYKHGTVLAGRVT